LKDNKKNSDKVKNNKKAKENNKKSDGKDLSRWLEINVFTQPSNPKIIPFKW